MPEALQRIRTELGKDAVILNTKEIRSGGFLGMFGKKKIEVIAAMDTNNPEPAPASTPIKQIAAVRAAVEAAAASSLNPAHGADNTNAGEGPPIISVPMSTVAGAYGREAQQSRPSKSSLSSSASQTPKQVAPSFPLSFEEELTEPSDTVMSAYNGGASNSTGSARIKPKEDMLLEEIKQMKEMMARLSNKIHDEPQYPIEISKYKSRLLDHEIEADLVERILRIAAEDYNSEDSPKTEQYAHETIRKQLMEILSSNNPKSIDRDTRIAHFVGPTGVGKTTTIAKLAAEQVLKYNRKVGFITSDTYRIAAVEQLKTYATILNVPLEVVFSPQELVRAFQQLQDCELIFMDTAGRNFRNPMYVSELNSLLNTKGKSETFLVMSLTSKYKDMKAITENFAKFRLDKVLFTKMDETRSYGSIINLLYDFPLQLSYMTNGQNVPDDILEVNEDQLISRILEEPNE
jgi:flagellar biosynthesis protein FlhF